MNFRITTLFFALLLTMLWVFGLMVAQKKKAAEPTAIMPTLQSPDVKIDKIVITKTEGKEESTLLEKIGDRWYLKEGEQQVHVPDFRIDEIIREVKDAKEEESADVSKELAHYGLKSPSVIVTLSGEEKKDTPKEWEFKIGKESPDKALYYVTSSDRSDRAFAVAKKSLDHLFLSDGPNALREKRLFSFIDSGVMQVAIKKGDKVLELKRGPKNLWTFVKPPLGFAGFDAPAEDKMPEDKNHPKRPPTPSVSGVKSLLDAVVKVKIESNEDFVPLGKPAAFYGLETDKPAMRIDITTENDKKEPVIDTLLVGKSVKLPRGNFYYVRLASDNGVMMIARSYFEPIEKALQDPGKIRSLDVAVFDPKAVDVVYVKQAKDEIKFFMAETARTGPDLYIGPEKKKANQVALKTLIDQILQKNAIVAFEFDNLSADALKKAVTAAGLDAPSLEIEVLVGALEPAKKPEEKADGDKKEEKKAETKKDTPPTLKKDAKPVVKLELGKTDGDIVHVRRTLQDGTVSYFTMKKEFVEKIAPPEGITLAYLDLALPTFDPDDAVSAELVRTTDKTTEKLELKRRLVNGQLAWYVKDSLDPTGYKLANGDEIERKVLFRLAELRAKKWLQKIGAKDDLDKFGLKNPVVSVSVVVKKHPATAKAVASLVGLSASGEVLLTADSALAWREADAGETIVFKFGKETDQAKDKPGAFATHSGIDLLFLVPTALVDNLRDVDLRDRSYLTYSSPALEALYLGEAIMDPLGILMFASPHMTGVIQPFEPDKVKEIKVAVRTAFELRTFHFAQNLKDKTWTDQSKLVDFQVDSEKVEKLVKEICPLKVDRFAAYTGGPRGEHKLGDKEFALKIDLTLVDGKTITLRVGAKYQNLGYFATSSYWPETVFFLPSTIVDPLLRGASSFGKQHTAN